MKTIFKIFSTFFFAILITSCGTGPISSTVTQVALIPFQVALGVPCLTLMFLAGEFDNPYANLLDEVDASHMDCYESIIDKTFILQQDIFYCRRRIYDMELYFLDIPGALNMPKSFEEYKEAPERWFEIRGYVEKGTELIIKTIYHKSNSCLCMAILLSDDNRQFWVDVSYLFDLHCPFAHPHINKDVLLESPNKN